ncbi:HpcH/HpaI aldolase/citrate lyase family protein [Pseudarthrobacter sulfonivorans]|uniref:HpcH/HpaI aldolase/citrate lyase family protein n=1 Tax=Pseudarthrobacter sulfonivorans TaxID=121292 RepID=UPI002866AF3B|nr:HpcH/HpaI aldolase/citrate lyase family protein [Pseudarthrobacter sulfonivorans]MDR6415300.1 citrate lyase beta subunit [Pseudarthrobacter sulfonivorans]
MRHFSFLTDEHASRLFHIAPQELSRGSAPALLAVALGATLYTPADRPNLAQDIRKQAARGCLSMVICLEDSIADDAVDSAETNVVDTLTRLYAGDPEAGFLPDEGPLLFVRVRTPKQMLSLARRTGNALDLLMGFVIPKFENETGQAQRFMDALHTINASRGGGRRMRIMPIMESPVMIHGETRASTLSGICDVLQANRDDVLAVRVGATDMSSAFGLRRSRDLTIYDVKVVASVIGDIVNMLGRPDNGFVISGPVWEHYSNSERVLRPLLRRTPFAEANEMPLRDRILTANLDGLIREIELDLANGLLGKTVIHPTHVPLVHAMCVVSHEEYVDALEIAGKNGGGASASPYGNKMNEMKPHQAWAGQTLLRAAAFGVAAENITYVDLLEASMN